MICPLVEGSGSGTYSRLSPSQSKAIRPAFVNRTKSDIWVHCTMLYKYVKHRGAWMKGGFEKSIEYSKAARQKRDARKPPSANALAVRRRRDRLVAQGLCALCGSQPRLDHCTVCQECREKSISEAKQRRAEITRIVYEHYSQGTPHCACCGETEQKFLSLDHINGGGYQDVRKNGNGPATFYNRLIKNGFPSGIQVLCMNCNTGKYRNGGICPHKDASIDKTQ